ncbi:MAG: hypothetical protein ACREJC_02295 [Tepidisphaeraceae bacterium]
MSGPRQSTLGIRAVICMGAVGLLIVLVVLHVRYINGPWYWTWPWRRLPATQWYLPLALAAAPVIAAFYWHARRPRSVVGPLLLLMIGSGSMKLSSRIVQSEPPGFTLLAALVRDSSFTSFYTDAAALKDTPDWLAIYPDVMPLTNLHTQSKPPGAVAYYRALIRQFGVNDRSAIIGGLGLMFLATLSIPALYFAARTVTGDRTAAICASALLAIVPASVLVSPALDSIFVVPTCAIICTWDRACRDGRVMWAALTGLILAATCFVTYNLLVLGVFLALYPFAIERDRRRTVQVLLNSAVAAGLVFTVFYLLLFAATAFNPITTFISAWRNQHNLLAANAADRPFPWTILFDLTDFALSGAWATVLLAAFGAARLQSAPRRIVVLGFAQILVVAISGLLQSETFRVWQFLLPLILIPASVELAAWTAPARTALGGSIILATLVMGQNMQM